MEGSGKQILTYLLTFLLAGFLGGCKEAVVANAEDVFDMPPEKGIDSVQYSSPSYPVVDSVRVLTAINPAVLPFNGRFFSSIAWNDRMGDNTLILSVKGKYDNGNKRKEIFAYHYVERDTSYDLLWQMNDFVGGAGCDLSIELIHFFPFISDIDSNGIAETAIFYSLDNRCDASFFPAKLIIHEGEKKFAIRGVRNQYLGPPEHVFNEYRADNGLPPVKYKNLDTRHSLLDSSIIHFYAHQWDDFIALENKLEGALPDSLIERID